MDIADLRSVIYKNYSINILTRHDIRQAINRGDMEALDTLINKDAEREYPRIKPEVRTTLSNMLAQINKERAARSEVTKTTGER